MQMKKVIGKFKDETEGVPIREFIGLRSEMYSLKKNCQGCSETCHKEKIEA